MSELTVVILAAGEGKRMRSRLPKVSTGSAGAPSSRTRSGRRAP